ncbi:MAG TPA: NAD(P)/FAD-dependent oxidoreductase [Streptosporangiaceae bacterium]|jgi:2-polyprenyl-6-methoxyphenol hydroxylase-like FAD-dependent oxidoreductase|nr:NAD(P)/FAD-dependent oxidoreductase [Streptosporangiaceae bacterium]
MTPVLECDVAICGAGVAGLTLALMLGQQGRSVLLLEKQRQFRMMHKGELIQPRSLEILAGAGALGALRARGARPVTALACRTAHGDELVSLDYRLLPGPFRHGMVQSYREMLETLAAQLPPSVTLRHGTRADQLVRDRAGRVSGVLAHGDGGTFEVRARLTVASDGHASRLRDAAGISVVPRRYGHQLVGFEIGDAPPLGTQMSAFLTDRGLRALFELGGQRARLYVQIPAEGFRAIGRAKLPEWADALVRSMPVLEPVAEPLRRHLGTVQVLSAWRFITPRWALPGFTVIGDAAHCVHPMVGQGMNAAIGDAAELATALAGETVLTAARADQAAARYEHARRPRLAYVSRLSHNMAALLTSSSWPGRVIRPGLLRRNQQNLRLRQRLTSNVAGLTAQPLTAHDWISASGLFNATLGRPETGDPFTAEGPA